MFTDEPTWAEPQPLALERIISGTPQGRMALGQAHPSCLWGQWEGTPGRFTAAPSPRDEVVTILSGRGTLRTTEGETFTLEPGVTFVIHAGFDGEWEITETIRKSFVFIDAA